MNQTHGKYDTRLYRIWQSMKSRCYNPNTNRYYLYGGRGISVCEEWRESFSAFYDWAISSGYSENLSIDRIDVNEGYNPQNCRWATVQEQQNNMRTNHYLTFAGKTMTIAEWSRETGIDHHLISTRLRRGWSIERALTEQTNK